MKVVRPFAIMLSALGLVVGVAQASGGWTLQGETTLVLGAALGQPSGGALPADLRARLRLETDDTRGWFAQVDANPRVSVGNLAEAGDVDLGASLGLTTALVGREGTTWRATAGLEGWPLGEGRLMDALSRGSQTVDVPRSGIWGARVTTYQGAVRSRVGLTVSGRAQDGPVKRAIGAASSVRYDGRDATIGAHLHGTRGSTSVVAAGLTASTTVASYVAYGDVWWVQPSGLRALMGVSGYLNQALWTVEGGWLPPDPTLLGALQSDNRAAVRMETSLPTPPATWTLAMGAAWPRLNDKTTTTADASLTWSRAFGDALVAISAQTERAAGTTVFGATAGWTVFFP